ncbi:olfactory receptor 1M1-like [Brachyhypopomus gauderio]|uniref:olfactory receptor 1M1-like n=1 Tax=Brachyhypopomus gauderio TaxID=698409 RepID=UPI0040420B3C
MGIAIMTTLTSGIYSNMSLVRPDYFFISGFSEMPFSKYYFVFLFFIYITSVFGNSVVFIMILTDRRLHIPKYIGIFNLALADFGETNAMIPNLMKTFVFDSQSISYEACLSNMFFVFVFSGVQSLTLVVLAYDRFIAICLPLRYHVIVNNSFITAVLIAVWSFSTALISTVVILITRLSFCKTNVVKSYFCDHGPIYTISCNNNSLNSFMAKVCTATLIYGPLLAIVLSYLGIFFALSRITTWEERLKALKTCASHLLVVGVFFLPLLGIYLAALISPLHPNVRIISTSLSYAIPPMLNPFIYALNTKEIRGVILKMLKKRSTVMAQDVMK